MKKTANERNGEVSAPALMTVAIIDDEEPMRNALVRLMKSAGIQGIAFPSAHEYLSHAIHRAVDCVVTDLRMPGFDGLKFQEEIKKILPYLSLVFITGHGDIAASVKAMKGGAVDFLEKPIDSELLLTAVRRAADHSRALKASHDELTDIERRYRRLTARERQVFTLVAAGLLNKQTASDLGIAEKTVKVHRARVMEKMGADSLADLVRMAGRLGVGSTGAQKLSALTR